MLFVIRHGETDWNAEGRLQGQQDIALNARGRDQARRNGQVLAGHLVAEGLDPAMLHYVASPLDRARETMEILRQVLGLPPTAYRLDDRLKEVSFGRFEGLTLAELATHDPAGFEAREANRWGFIPHGGESYAMLAERVAPLLSALAGPAVLVAHGGVLRALYHLLLGHSTEEVMTMPVRQDRVHLFAAGTMRLF
ncbi:MAG TPA: histidine phosphatase family protein [Thermoleophilaceae bacterium]|nr:histidine phosphatase family protein [Thermoleophilaceae bacterium]